MLRSDIGKASWIADVDRLVEQLSADLTHGKKKMQL